MKSILTGLLVIGICIFIFIFCFMYKNRIKDQSNENPLLNQVKQNFIKLSPSYADIPLIEGDSSYTENKNFISLCLKNPETKQNYDINTIMYVALHELSHVLTFSHGHGQEFKDKFTSLLQQSTKLGIYNPNIPMPQTYCGVKG